MLFLKMQPTVWHLVPPLINFVTHSPDVLPEDFAETHTVVCGAASLGDKLITKFQNKFKGVLLCEGFGLTEMSPCTHMIPVVNHKAGKWGEFESKRWSS